MAGGLSSAATLLGIALMTVADDVTAGKKLQIIGVVSVWLLLSVAILLFYLLQLRRLRQRSKP